jgi:hypothetical protein
VEGQKQVRSLGLVSQAGIRFEAAENITFGGSYQEIQPGGWGAHEHVNDMALYGVSQDMLQPSNRSGFFWISYPHVESTWPKSQEIMGRMLTDLSEGEQNQITGGNVARLYPFQGAWPAVVRTSTGCRPHPLYPPG